MYPPYRFSVAPMMDCTDRHCRYFHRLLSRHALLYTEMLTAQAVVFGNADRLLKYAPEEHPLALQLGGSDPELLGRAAQLGVEAGFDEINLNAGCPSPRVRHGSFGAVLMTMPKVAGDCVEAILDVAGNIPVSVKCRIGVDDQNPEVALPEFIEAVRARGVNHIIVHARKALLSGLSPKQNRTVPPLDYDLVVRTKERFQDLVICINGGIPDLVQARKLLDRGLDGVMVGRAAYSRPLPTLLDVDELFFDSPGKRNIGEVVDEMCHYLLRQHGNGIPYHQVSRHMSGLFFGAPHARAWRRLVSEPGALSDRGVETIREAARKCLDTRPLEHAVASASAVCT